MSFPIVYLLIPYGIFLLLWLTVSAIAIYHMLRFGFKTSASYITLSVYLIVAVLILVVSANYIATIDWTGSVSIFEAFFIN